MEAEACLKAFPKFSAKLQFEAQAIESTASTSPAGLRGRRTRALQNNNLSNAFYYIVLPPLCLRIKKETKH